MAKNQLSENKTTAGEGEFSFWTRHEEDKKDKKISRWQDHYDIDISEISSSTFWSGTEHNVKISW